MLELLIFLLVAGLFLPFLLLFLLLFLLEEDRDQKLKLQEIGQLWGRLYLFVEFPDELFNLLVFGLEVEVNEEVDGRLEETEIDNIALDFPGDKDVDDGAVEVNNFPAEPLAEVEEENAVPLFLDFGGASLHLQPSSILFL